MLNRKLLSLTLVLGLTLGTAALAGAFDLGGTVKSKTQGAAKGAAKGAVAKEYNKRLKEMRCRFVGDSATKFEGCDINKIIDEMNTFRTVAEKSGFANDVDILVETYGKNWDLANERGETLRDKVKTRVGTAWDYSISYHKADSNEVYFQVSVD